ncbi:MAG TPA: YhcN/YlaJ family sporulation lipoprotein [Bacillales bacterium]|nr:YhcN/YlaJ family sporulation lipoprotein [Bacillales bacterium]
MKKTIFSLSAALLMSGALVGCGANNGAVGNGNNGDGVRPIGYYGGNHDNTNNGIVRDRNGRIGANNGRMGANNNNVNHYNRRLNNRQIRDMNGPYANGANRKYRHQAQVIANRVASMKNVENASVVVTDNDVLIGVKTNDKTTKGMKSGIRKTAQTVVQGKNIHVATKPRMYNRIKNVHNNLRDGNTVNEVGSDIRGIINDLGNAAKRPFQNNAR